MEYIIRYVFAYAIHRIASIFCMPYAIYMIKYIAKKVHSAVFFDNLFTLEFARVPDTDAANRIYTIL